LAYGSEAGTSMLQRTRVAQAGLRLADTHRDALRMGPGFADTKPYTLTTEGGSALAALLATVERPGGFYASGRMELLPPRLEVDGVGQIALPLLPVQAEQLIRRNFLIGPSLNCDPARRKSRGPS